MAIPKQTFHISKDGKHIDTYNNYVVPHMTCDQAVLAWLHSQGARIADNPNFEAREAGA